MQNLHIYPTTSIQEAADDLMEQYRLGALNAHELGADLCRFVLRGSQGVYYAYDARQRRWYRYLDEAWQSGSDPLDCLEGPADLPVDLPLEKEETFEEPSIAGQAEGGQMPATRTLQEVVKMVAGRYASGKLDLLDADEILRDYLLMDRQGRAWRAGAHTGSWYAYVRDGWKAFQAPPAEQDLVKIEALVENCPLCGATLEGRAVCPSCHKPVSLPFDLPGEAAETFLQSLLAATRSLPEPLSDPWEPPAWYPDAIQIDGLVCPTCQEQNRPDSNFCFRCGSVLAPLSAMVEPQPSGRFCTHCGAELKPNKKFCSQCGRPVGEKADHGLPR